MDSVWVLIFLCLVGFAFLQNCVVNIGNRPYSMWYESHFLIKKKGIIKLIYFKPKHFHRYSLFEVVSFFMSYLILFSGIILTIISRFYPNILIVSNIAIGATVLSQILFEVVVIIIIEVTKAKEDAFYKEQRAVKDDLEVSDELKKIKIDKKDFYDVFDFFRCSSFQLESIYIKRLKQLKGKEDKINLLDEEFIQYYRNYKKIIVEDGEIIFEQNLGKDFN